jgi:hypothetical protein
VKNFRIIAPIVLFLLLSAVGTVWLIGVARGPSAASPRFEEVGGDPEDGTATDGSRCHGDGNGCDTDGGRPPGPHEAGRDRDDHAGHGGGGRTAQGRTLVVPYDDSIRLQVIPHSDG